MARQRRAGKDMNSRFIETGVVKLAVNAVNSESELQQFVRKRVWRLFPESNRRCRFALYWLENDEALSGVGGDSGG